MLHGRVVRPPAIGANLLNVDESSVQGMPGVVKVVRLVEVITPEQLKNIKGR